jgi:signal transduction histidine kinase/DNA-binding response OmpR family regulator
MKKAFIIALISVVLLIVSNISFYHDTFRWQLKTHQEMLKKELVVCNNEISRFFSMSQSNLMLMFNPTELELLMKNPEANSNILIRIKKLYSTYPDLLTEIKIHDANGTFYSIRKGSNESFISMYGTSLNPNAIRPRISVSSDKKSINIYQPLFEQFGYYGGIEMVLDLQLFFKKTFQPFKLEEYQYQWVIQTNGNILYKTPDVKPLFNSQEGFSNELKTASWFVKQHEIGINNINTSVITVFQPINAFGDNYFLAFSLPTNLVTLSVATNSFWVGLISLLMILIIFGIFGAFIRRRAASEKQMRLTQDALKKMIYYLPSGIILINDNQKIVQVNRSLLKIFSYEDEDLLVDHPYSEQLLFDNVEVTHKHYYTEHSGKYVINRHNRNGVVITNEKIPFYIGNEHFLIDVYTEIPQIDKDSSANSPSKAETTFIANISHELRTPLNGIIGMADLLSHSQWPEAEDEMISILKRSADTLLLLINDILDFSKIESGKFDIESISFDLRNEMEETFQSFAPQAKSKKLLFSWDASVPLPDDFVGDPVRIRQVLNNLISNAIKFTHEGKIQISINKTRALNGSPALLFSIKDTGIGIEKEKLKSIFRSFYQADESTTRKYGGTGLGTTISKQLVNLMGGDIWAESPSGLSDKPNYPGTEFCFTLPLRTRRQPKALNLSQIKEFSQIHAVVITDDPLHVPVITRNMMALHIEYRILSPTRETIDILRTSQRFHLLVIDNRNDFNGLDFLQELYNLNLHKNYIVLFQSSDNQKTSTILARRIGADAYLRKPVKLIVFRDFILKHFTQIQSKTPVSQKEWPEQLRILVVEDNRLNQRVAQNLFRRIGFRIEVASNGIEALEKASATSYHIIFMDIFMPGMDGIEAVKQLKRNNVKCPIVAMTASNEASERQRAFDVGMDDYITKPAKVEEILRMLTKWCYK